MMRPLKQLALQSPAQAPRPPAKALLAQPQRRATKDDYTAADFEACSGFLHQGSSSFYAASKLLPPDVRRGTVMLYSFCRLADDLVDELGDPERALTILHNRLDRVYDGVPCDHAVDRGLLCAAETWRIPKAVFVALLEGFQWDSEERHYETIDELIAYCVRVASTVGVMMTLVMGESSIPTLARACDLGVAFQLTNIARDVGEDARNDRCYLPEEWLRAEGLSSRDLIAKPELSEGLRKVVDRMLRVADQIYADAELGVRMLPYSCQPAVQAAHLIYRAIGSVLRDDLDLDSISSRARTSGRQTPIARYVLKVSDPASAEPAEVVTFDEQDGPLPWGGWAGPQAGQFVTRFHGAPVVPGQAFVLTVLACNSVGCGEPGMPLVFLYGVGGRD